MKKYIVKQMGLDGKMEYLKGIELGPNMLGTQYFYPWWIRDVKLAKRFSNLSEMISEIEKWNPNGSQLNRLRFEQVE